MNGYLTTSYLAFVIQQAKRYLQGDRSPDHTDLQQQHHDMKTAHQLLMDHPGGGNMAEAAVPEWDGGQMLFLLKSSRAEDMNKGIDTAKMGSKTQLCGWNDEDHASM